MLAVRNQEVQMLMPTEADWKIIRETMIILEPLERATVYLSAAQYPTIADIRFVFLGILEHLESIIGDDDFEQKELASSVNQKIGEYWNIINQQTLVSTVLDPRYKLSL
ncbi:hypothetical protein RclHR1_11290008 [Rhizophagus clarus]|nr:hypothetical protein RclHR1_11290008 [Rhizophagus clarus]